MDNEGIIRITLFLLTFIVIASWEKLRPKRLTDPQRISRWLTNLGLMLSNTLIVRIIFPMAAVGMALYAEQHQLGILNSIDIPIVLAVPIAVIAMDMFIYFQHVLFHAVPTLWRLHMVHHTDLEYDLTTGVRFHPIEIAISMALKSLVIIALGPPAVAVIIFEILLNSCAMFNHGNIKLPPKLDQILRKLIVTPDMHRIHHSTIKRETNSNYGFNLSVWDKWFGTYKEDAIEDQTLMPIGLENYRHAPDLSYLKLLKLPFIAKIGQYPINKD